MKSIFSNKKELTFEQIKEETYKRLCSEAAMEDKAVKEERLNSIQEGSTIKGDMYLDKNTGEITINEKYVIKPLMMVGDIKNNLIDVLTDEGIEELKLSDPSFITLKTIDDGDFSINFELCLYGERLEKIRMSVVSTNLIDLAYTEFYKFELKAEHAIEYLEKFARVDFVKRDRIIFNTGILTVIADERESDVKILINYHQDQE